MSTEQAIVVVPDEDPLAFDIYTTDPESPWSAIWWTAQSVSGVPEQVMGWLIAQGWEITGITSDTTTVPPTLYYALGKQGMQPQNVLLGLCNSYTDAAIKAQNANEWRYNQVVLSWTGMIESTHEHFTEQIDEQNATAGIFLTDLDSYMDDVDTLIDENQAKLTADVDAAKAILEEMNTKLAELEANADGNATTSGELLLAQAGYLSSFLTDLSAKMAELNTNYSAHLTLIQAIITDSDTDEATFIASQASELTDLLAEYDTHADTAIQFLVDLGTTEEARINEEFAASLSTQIQGLIDKGLYTSILETDITARNTRDRDEQIQALKDRLNREKFENQHQLYGQQVNMRTRRLEEAARRQQISMAVNGWKASQLDRLLEQLQQVDLKQAQGIETQHSAQHDVSRVAMSQRDTLLGQLQAAVSGILAGKEKYAAMTMQNAAILAESKHKLIQEKMNAAVARLDGWKDVADDNRKLMAYQLDERNKLLVGLYSFVERREDIAPEWKDMASMIAGLGDSSGGWLTP